ncbi:PIR protein [Plasmodium vivax]|uniref:VIR protein n=1 Tax=Plasmodium vivax TaxID=5855 RepID=A0A565A443_PLAVI|nr:PIR protein [Plasmodium vivax]
MAKCTCKAQKYIDYNCYYCLNSRFPNCNMTQDGWKYLNNALNSMNPKITNFTTRNEFLKWIVKHLICTSVFWDIDTNIACKYINFWLNKKVKVFDFYEYNSNFNNFKEFVNKFYTVVEGDFSSYKNCSNNIQLLDDDEYKKMDMLYTLYNEYDELKKIHPDAYIEFKTCEIIQNITKLANDIARSYKNDDEFIKVLRDLRDKIKNGEGRYKELCASKLQQLDTMVTLEAFPDKVPVSQPPKGISQSTDSLAQHVSEKGIGKQSQPIVDLQEGSPTEQLRSEEHRTQVSHAMIPSKAQQHRGSSLVASHHESSRHEGELYEGLFKSTPYSGEQYEQSRDAQPRSVHTRYKPVEEGYGTEGGITSTEGAQSYLENIRGTITGVFESVQPAPILGVSGGMGALFLLFKYTPVGTFFGGRRRRNHLIPSGFPVAYPGFPGYEEQYGANFGPGPINISYQAE